MFPEIAQAVQLRAEAHGYATLVIDSGNAPMREEKVVRTLAKHGVDGAVALTSPRAARRRATRVTDLDMKNSSRAIR